MINYRTIQNLNQVIQNNLHKLPAGIEVIAGVHRSGQLAANILGTHLNLPVISFRNVCDTEWIYAGHRSYVSPEDQEVFLNKPRTILVVEDATNSGATLMLEKDRYSRSAGAKMKHRLIYLTVYPSQEVISGVDITMEVVPRPRIFEWNWLNHSLMSKGIVAIDGLLCHDPSDTGNYDTEVGEKNYRNYVQTAKPLHIPKRFIRRLVTHRLVKWHHMTEKWLADQGITYETLNMMPCKTAQERHDYGVVKFKVATYQHHPDAELFFEPNPAQAKAIYQMTGRPVFCVKSKKLLQKA